MAKLKIYNPDPAGRYDIFRGKTHTDRWYVYDTKDKRYVGGFFKTLKAARDWVDEEGD